MKNLPERWRKCSGDGSRTLSYNACSPSAYPLTLASIGIFCEVFFGTASLAPGTSA